MHTSLRILHGCEKKSVFNVPIVSRSWVKFMLMYVTVIEKEKFNGKNLDVL